MAEHPPPRRLGTSAKALLLTVLGELVLPHGGTIWTQTVVYVLGLLGVEERNARQAIARLAEQGYVVADRQGRRTQWALSSTARALLQTGTDRIYSFGVPNESWEERWLVVFCSVPEQQRAQRRRLRSRLSFEGFGWIAPGLAVTPHLDREDHANLILEDLGLASLAVVFRAEAGTLAPATDILHRAWDLDGLGEQYDDFIAAFRRRSASTEEAQLGALIELVHSWRRFPSIDPEIPDTLLPRSWPGRRGKQLFDARHAAWFSGAGRRYREVERCGF